MDKTTVLNERNLAFMKANNLTIHSTFFGPANKFLVKREDGRFAIAKPSRKAKGGVDIGATLFDNAETAMAKLRETPRPVATTEPAPAEISQSG